MDKFVGGIPGSALSQQEKQALSRVTLMQSTSLNGLERQAQNSLRDPVMVLLSGGTYEASKRQ